MTKLSLLLSATLMAATTALPAAEVRIHTDAEGNHTLMRGGQPYLAKGANWPVAETIGTLAEVGGNSVRTYGDEIEWMLPLARKHSLSILAGIYIGRERQGFDYSDQQALDAQFEEIRAFVQKYKNEPEILMWALGNEPELRAKNTVPLWKEVNRLAKMIREEDPHHPVITVVAGFNQKKISELTEHCPELDALGVNAYGPVNGWPARLQEYGWAKPYLHTEFGPGGYWEGGGGHGMTAWGAPIEQTSTEKAAFYAENWANAVAARPGQSLGGYAFIWCTKQERTHTWFSMFLPTGERIAPVGAMQMAWTGVSPANPAPEILEWEAERTPWEYQPGETITISLRWKCERPANISLEMFTESTADQWGGDAEPVPTQLPEVDWRETPGGIEVKAPTTPGKYRVFLMIATKDATAATANLPFQVLASSN